jgi:hypothetical protein
MDEDGAMPTSLYWRHQRTGELYAVRVNYQGILDGAAGSLPPSAATAAQLPHWPFVRAAGEQLRGRFLEFEPVSEEQ